MGNLTVVDEYLRWLWKDIILSNHDIIHSYWGSYQWINAEPANILQICGFTQYIAGDI